MYFLALNTKGCTPWIQSKTVWKLAELKQCYVTCEKLNMRGHNINLDNPHNLLFCLSKPADTKMLFLERRVLQVKSHSPLLYCYSQPKTFYTDR